MSAPADEQFYTAQKAGFEVLRGLSTEVLRSVGEIAELNWRHSKQHSRKIEND
jgi:hypothetical protein